MNILKGSFTSIKVALYLDLKVDSTLGKCDIHDAICYRLEFRININHNQNVVWISIYKLNDKILSWWNQM